MRIVSWFVDRWRKSTAYTDMTLAEQGAYRNLIDECHIRPNGAIPDDERILGRAAGDEKEWPRVRAAVMAHFNLTPEGWRHETVGPESTIATRDDPRYAPHADRRSWGNLVRLAGNPRVTHELVPPQAPRNPLVEGRRGELELETLKLVRAIAERTGRDPTEVIAEAAAYHGAQRQKLNPATMTDDRLIATLNDLRADLRALDARAFKAKPEDHETARQRPGGRETDDLRHRQRTG